MGAGDGEAGFAMLAAHTKDLPASSLALTRLLTAVDLFPQGEAVARTGTQQPPDRTGLRLDAAV